MKKKVIRFTKEQKIFLEEAQVSRVDQEYLLSSLNALYRGSAPTPSFKLYDSVDKEVAIRWLELNKDAMPNWMYEYEKTRLDKWGPQGGYKPFKDMKANLMLYKTRPTKCNINRRLQVDVLSKYKHLGARVLSADETLKSLIAQGHIENRAAGCRDFSLKKTDKVAQRHALADYRSGLWWKFIAYTFARYNKLKDRLFTPGPFSAMIAQAKLTNNIMTKIQDQLHLNNYEFAFWSDKVGFDTCFKMLDEQYQARRKNGNYITVFVQTDFEKMDTTTSAYQSSACFVPFVQTCLGSKDPEIEKVLNFSNFIPIFYPGGILTGNKGEASGSNVTNMKETACSEQYQAEVIHEVMDILKHLVHFIANRGNGDDGMQIWQISAKLPVEKFREVIASSAERVAKRMGFRVQGDKWLVSTNYGLYCQNMIWIEHNHIRWAYPAILIFNAIMNPEHEYTHAQWDKDYRDLDIDQKLDNGRNHPAFHSLVDYVDNGLKYPLLGRTEKETERILSKYGKYRALQFRTERYNREDWNITSSPTLLYILNKRKA